MQTRLERRAFIVRLGVVGLAAAAAGVVTKASRGDVTVTPGAPLVIDGSADFGAVHLRGGHITTTGGGVITIQYLKKV